MRASLFVALSLALTGPLLLSASGCNKETERPDGGTGMLEVGAQAPKLSATAHDGSTVDLAALGEPAVVYFYPADDTPGCTAEACAFRDVWNEYEAANVLVIGVSTQDLASKKTFAEKHELPFPLIADTDKSWAKAFGVKVNGGYAKRVSFLLDATGKIAKVYPDVDPGVHAQQVLKDAAAL